MWLAGGSTIYRVNPTRDSILQFSRREGFDGNRIVSLNEHDGNLYVGTQDDGIIVICPLVSPGQKRWTVESFGKEHGINKLVGTERSDIVTNDGSFLWGDKGITILRLPHPDSIGPQTVVAGVDLLNNPLYFANGHRHDADADSFYPGQQHIEWDSVSGPFNIPVNLRLPFDDNNIQFHFTQIHGDGSGKPMYRYFLRGVDKKWSAVGSDDRTENYLNLPPGDYTFEVASLYHGKWTSPASLSFTILPPWWKTWWAWLLYVLVACGLVYGIVQYRSRWLQKENERLEEIVKIRTNELKESLEHLQATQAQLIQSEKMASLGELTAGIAHEIQNPLNFVNNFSEVNQELLSEMKDGIDRGNMDDVKSIANDIIENEQKILHHGKRADAIVKGMLQHSRASTGQKEPTDINALADEYLRLSYHGLRAKDKSLHAETKTDFDGGIGKVAVIPQDIGRVLLNLFNNAFYAVAEKENLRLSGYEPTVSVSTKKMDDKVEIRVKDNGEGIPKKVLDKIFQPFFTTKPTGQGTGLGLSMSYDIVKAHGGKLEVETKEGAGSVFIIFLPLR
jgi:signal transduction histidine kinase